jgi:hypothetical protein
MASQMILSRLKRLWSGLCLLLFCLPSQAVKVIVSSQDEVSSIIEKIEKLPAGDTLVFRPGVYKGPFPLSDIHGLPNCPVVLVGISEGSEMATIDGESVPGMDLRNNAFQMENCSWVVIEGFRIKNCWTDIITSVDVSYQLSSVM